MPYIAIISIIGAWILLAAGGIPQGSVGGSMAIALAMLFPIFAVPIHEAWTRGRGVLGYVANILVAFFGVMVIAPTAGGIMAILLSPLMDGSSIAKSSGPVMYIALAGMVGIVMACGWGSIWLLNLWRDRKAAAVPAKPE